MTTPTLPTPQRLLHIVQDECQDLLAPAPAPTAAVVSALLAHGRGLPPLRLIAWQPCQGRPANCRGEERA